MAQSSRIFVQHCSAGRPDITLEIVGDNLALVVKSYDIAESKLFIFKWKTGHQKLVCYLFPIYPAIYTFLDRIMNLQQASTLSLALFFYHQKPLLARMSNAFNTKSGKSPRKRIVFTPNPESLLPALFHDIPHAPPRPFHTSTDNTIIIIINIQRRPSVAPGEYLCSITTLVMHRHALLDAVINLICPDELLTVNPTTHSSLSTTETYHICPLLSPRTPKHLTVRPP